MSIKQRIIFSNSIGFNLGCKKLRIIARKKITRLFIKRVVKQYAYKRVPEKIFQNEFKRVLKFYSSHECSCSNLMNSDQITRLSNKETIIWKIGKRMTSFENYTDEITSVLN